GHARHARSRTDREKHRLATGSQVAPAPGMVRRRRTQTLLTAAAPMPLAFGQIVWAEVADSNGIPKGRPAVILTPTDQISESGPVDCVAITSRLPDPIPEDHVLLPWQSQGHPRTGLKRRCAAVCTWRACILPADVENVAGTVPGPLMVEILRKISAST